MAIYPEQVLDLPNLKEFMATTIFELVDKEIVDPSQITFYKQPEKSGDDDETDDVMVEDYFTLMAHVLSLYYDKNRDWAEVKKFYEKTGIKKQFVKMHPLILQDNLFDDFENEINDKDKALLIKYLLD
jgi:hypothetical protein